MQFRTELVSALLALALATSGCVAAPRAGETVTLRGTLTLVGNEPFATPVLAPAAGGRWALQGLTPCAVRTLQNRQVEVIGTVVREASEGARLPALDVTRIEPACGTEPRR